MKLAKTRAPQVKRMKLVAAQLTEALNVRQHASCSDVSQVNAIDVQEEWPRVACRGKGALTIELTSARNAHEGSMTLSLVRLKAQTASCQARPYFFFNSAKTVPDDSKMLGNAIFSEKTCKAQGTQATRLRSGGKHHRS